MKAVVPPPDPADRAFRTWLHTLAVRLDTDPEGALASRDALAFLWSAFVEIRKQGESVIALMDDAGAMTAEAAELDANQTRLSGEWVTAAD
ncbi:MULTISPECIES: hypothetical protein [unclassified Streptomyces]|uniref:hypothetical protein n=1 Tax=unclassified Streptomyces TaxID=2593676 RepID=UPI000A722A2F|nr:MULTISPECIES: hypothetical protein [unclassified Streptomyces]MBT2376328.1 hypothetical protein [Streptomyces sp. ISL-111]